MPAKKSTTKRVTRAAKSLAKKGSSAVKKGRSAMKKVRKAVNVRATTARARKIGDAAITAGAILKQTADVVDAVAQTTGTRRRKVTSPSRKSTKK